MDFQTRPAKRAFVITPHASNLLEEPVRAIVVGVEGTISFENWEGVTCTTASLPAGIYPIYAQKVFVTGTTASQLTGLV